jgi:hypothetical protein
MSEVKVNKISPRTGCGTVTLGDSGDTFTVPSGVTITNNGTQTGFGRTGTVDWVTTPKTAGFTAATGEGYFCNTTGGIFTVALPAGAAGSIVSLADYAATWQTNNLTVSPDGSEKIGGTNSNVTLSTEGQSVTFVYVDSTQGWVNTMDSTSNVRGASYIVATGGNQPTAGGCIVCTNYKIHKFTAPGTFCVSSGGNAAGSNTVDYLVVAGGGAGSSGWGSNSGGGGGAGGYRESPGTASGCYSVSPLGVAPAVALPVTATGYPITVGGGGGATPGPSGRGCSGSNSVFSTITSTGGGAGGAGDSTPGPSSGAPGGSGGGGRGSHGTFCAGAGNTPPFSPPQGKPGGNCSSGGPIGDLQGGGGGGATVAGTNGTTAGPGSGGAGGAGGTTSISATPTAYGGGGGGGAGPGGTGGTAGTGGGGAGGCHATGCNGTINTGGGAGGGGNSPGTIGGSGGSGIVYIRYKFQ